MKPILVLVLALILATLTGCQTTERTQYQTLATVMVSVDAAMTAYGDAVRLGLVDTDDQRTVKQKFDQYKRLERAALQAAQFDLETASPQQLGLLASQLTLQIAQLLD